MLSLSKSSSNPDPPLSLTYLTIFHFFHRHLHLPIHRVTAAVSSSFCSHPLKCHINQSYGHSERSMNRVKGKNFAYIFLPGVIMATGRYLLLLDGSLFCKHWEDVCSLWPTPSRRPKKLLLSHARWWVMVTLIPYIWEGSVILNWKTISSMTFCPACSRTWSTQGINFPENASSRAGSYSS